VISAWVPASVADGLREIAARHDRSMSGELRHVVRLHLATLQTSEAALAGGSTKTRGTARDATAV
jgi:plasmid stability protein